MRASDKALTFGLVSEFAWNGRMVRCTRVDDDLQKERLAQFVLV